MWERYDADASQAEPLLQIARQPSRDLVKVPLAGPPSAPAPPELFPRSLPLAI